jgi:hypothetical protein
MLRMNQSEGDRLLLLTREGARHITVLDIPAHHKVLVEVVKGGESMTRVVVGAAQDAHFAGGWSSGAI